MLSGRILVTEKKEIDLRLRFHTVSKEEAEGPSITTDDPVRAVRLDYDILRSVTLDTSYLLSRALVEFLEVRVFI
ncbi:hypothetical protein T265_10974 [Opisthorchis viverrini]|uniref:Uncharacterized protein n=1 Tax=Opisthorchis viverrini TaxID=6198 RepID=A0A074ZZ81_OPIVI|nr:hypothetical protein T265_10974 [Opisthorchis viverrini]KER20489.1 hypothetical protein T265_10974 [Opisthorchis viverrini]